ncbi:MAG TPA: TIM barrel protein [Bryobacteraceae bacterium]|nr:TIM barrel protein [Bryobacteraceae bacterium]
MTRRTFMPAAAGALTLAAQDAPKRRPGKLKQAVCPGVFGRQMPLEDRCRHTARLGLYGIDLIGPKDWPTLKKYGLIPTMSPGGASIRDGINRAENHDAIEKRLREIVDQAAANGVPNVISLAGERKGQSPEQGIENCVTFLNRVKGQLEDKGVTLCIEYLNSKVNHPDYDFDHMKYGVEVCRRVNSPRVKILYDIYHAQIMEGDVIRTIKSNLEYIAHLHTAGNPGRHEMDDTQELNYRAIARALVDMGYSGYISHEYSPVREPIASLEETLKIFDVA